LPTVVIIPEEVEPIEDGVEEPVEEEIVGVPVVLPPREEVEETSIVEEDLIKIFTFVKQELVDEESEVETKYVPIKIEDEAENIKTLVNSETLLSLPVEIFEKDVIEIIAEVEGETIVLEYNAESQAYEALITTPEKSGQYSVNMQVVYTDDTYEELTKTIEAVPYGVVIEKKFGSWFSKEIAVIPSAEVSIYNEVSEDEWKLWQASEYNQYNPQVTSENGNFIFLVPDGKYYIEVTAPGYEQYKSKVIEVTDDIVAPEIELRLEGKRIVWGWALFLGLVGFIFILYTLKRKK
jgi:hypothetical protein